MIGDVLNSAEILVCSDEEERKDKIYSLWCLCYEVGIRKSLNEILDSKTGFRCSTNNRINTGSHTCAAGNTHTEEYVDKKTQELFEFLYDLFENEL